jgi:HK97 family phage portal protein
MSVWDWLGPLNAGSKRRGWSELPSPSTAAAPALEQKAFGLDGDAPVTYVPLLVHGPGASDILGGWRNGSGNSAVFACLQAISSSIAEPELTVYKVAPGERVEQEGTPLGALLRRPNPHFSMDTLLWYMANCLKVDGNAYWRKLRSGNPETGAVVELWPISPTRITPVTDRGSGDFISRYRYYHRPGQYEDISPDNIVHFRVGMDDGDHRVGVSALKRLIREVSSDAQATRYADRLLSNLAINGLSLEFPPDARAITPAVADELKARISAAYGGDNVGAVSVLSPGAKLTQHGFSPEQMDMKTLHRVPEERISAVIGVPAIIAGLGAGLEHATYANAATARELFTEMTLIPMWRAIAATLTTALVPDFSSDSAVIVDFNISTVRALQDDEDKKANRLKIYVEAGILDINEARAEIGRGPRQTAPAAAPEQRGARPRLVTLARQRKSAEDVPSGLERLREAREPNWERAIRTFLEEQKGRATRALRAGADDASDLIVEGEARLLGEVLEPLQLSLFDDVQRLVIAELGIAFDLDDPATREYLRQAGQNIVAITNTTGDAVRTALIEGQANGEGIPQLARRLRDLPAFDQARARVVARTELGHSQIEGALASYRASGVVVGVRIHDGDEDAACAGRDGTVMTLDAAGGTPRLIHPNCTAAFAPVVDASELSRAS